LSLTAIGFGTLAEAAQSYWDTRAGNKERVQTVAFNMFEFSL
jgi:hypothetical protein